MIDSDLAELYGVETKNLNRAVKRNTKRFPEDFMLQLSVDESNILRCQFGTSKTGSGGRRSTPYAFTQEGIAILSGVLHSDRAIQANIAIVRAFVKLRELIESNRELNQKLIALESKYDGKFKQIFDAIRELMSTHSVPRKRIIGLGISNNKD